MVEDANDTGDPVSQNSTAVALPEEVIIRAKQIIEEMRGTEAPETLEDIRPTGNENIVLMGQVLAYADWEVARARRENERSRFDMNFWISGTIKKTEDGAPPPMTCGTSACLAGTAAAFTMGRHEIMTNDRIGRIVMEEVEDWEADADDDGNYPTKLAEVPDLFESDSVEDRGRKELGLSYEQSFLLFRTYNYELPDIKAVASFMTGVDFTGDLSALLPEMADA